MKVIELESMMLSKVCQIQQDKNCLSSFVWIYRLKIWKRSIMREEKENQWEGDKNYNVNMTEVILCVWKRHNGT